ncbi:MAG: HAD-IIA family hydrolase [Christensenellales bacterium]|jgi:HAD superfamily hydrolase (TIGR01457 family)
MPSIENVKLFLLDMDGTFYLGEKILPGSLEFIEKVRESGRDFLFLTNNSSHNAQYYAERLARMGLVVDREKILTSTLATAEKVNELYPGKRAFVLGNSFMREELSESGVRVDDTNPEIVIIGYDTTLDYAKMTAVCDFVRAGLPYIASHPDFNCPTETGFAPDIGAIIAFIEASTGRVPDLVVGKPNRGIVEAVIRRTGLNASDMAMVGDRLYTDIETGLRFGMLSVLVLSGETTPEMAAASETKPHMTLQGLADMIPML